MSQPLKRVIIDTIKEIILENNLSTGELNIYLENPKEKIFGDWSVNIAMKLAKQSKKPPRELAEFILRLLQEKLKVLKLSDKIEKMEIKPPGFINIFLGPKARSDVLKIIQQEKANFGHSQSGKGKKVLIEFVSANPTGPLSIAHARQAAVGDSLANILSFFGYEVNREYYINDEGNQIKILGESLIARYREYAGEKNIQFPEDGYKGDYLKEIAKKLKDDNECEKYSSEDEFKQCFADIASDNTLTTIKSELKELEVNFDNWFSQKKNITNDKIKDVLEELDVKGFIYEKDGATWFKSTSLGDDKDRVLVKSDGNYTYLTPDIAYHKDKFKRGFTRLINIWGPDHHGYIKRLKAAVCALGHKEEDIDILIIQLTTLFRKGKPVAMSTRAGEYITLVELIDEVGKDAARFFFLMRRCDSHLEFNLELAKKQSPENPVYYVQYAYARIVNIKKLKDETHSGFNEENVDYSLLKEEEAVELIRLLSRFPDVVEDCAINLEPQTLTVYLRELAGQFHVFYDKHRVVAFNSEPELSLARFCLVDCVRQVIHTGLKLLGVSAPERM